MQSTTVQDILANEYGLPRQLADQAVEWYSGIVLMSRASEKAALDAFVQRVSPMTAVASRTARWKGA
jgi:hypothetical protein